MFPEMDGNIVHVDYDRNSWRYMNYERSNPKEDLNCYRIGCAIRQQCDILEPYRVSKGGGSAYGGQWVPNPNKPNEVILKGSPNTIQRHYIPGKNGGYWVQVKYGDDGWAVKIRHETIHTPNQDHTDPHDHIIEYDPSHRPIYVKPQINYPIELYPDGAPEFKVYYQSGVTYMAFYYNAEELRFKTISEFKRSLHDGGEIVIEWCDRSYGIFFNGTQFYLTSQDGSTDYFQTADDLLEWHICGDRLRDVITQVTVLDRAL